MQEIQERPQAGDEGNEGGVGRSPAKNTNQPISESANQLGAPWSAKEIQERPQAGDEGNEGVWAAKNTNQPISESANQPGAPWSAKEIQERPQAGDGQTTSPANGKRPLTERA